VQKTDAWLQPILDLVATQGGRGGTLLAFPEYRPDLAKAIAHAVGIRFYDFRAETMAQKGFQAGAMGLDELDAVLADLAAEGGALVLNVEALVEHQIERGARGMDAGVPSPRLAWSIAGTIGPLRPRGPGRQRARLVPGARRPPGTGADQSTCELA